jgi:hypothetical protein
VAKKTRTPKPPRAPGSRSGGRPVQAPQRRTGSARRPPATTSARTGSRYIWPIAAVVVALAIVGIALGVALTRGSTKYTASYSKQIPWNNLPGLQTNPPPWPANATLMTTRARAVGVQSLGQEQLKFHIHQHLDLYVDGKKVTIPLGVGIQANSAAQTAVFAELHTHNASGLIHVESGRPVTFTLGQFFAVWGVRLTRNCIGSFKGSCGRVQYWVNGKKLAGNPAQLVLKNHQEIAIVIGKPPATVPPSFDFSGYGV